LLDTVVVVVGGGGVIVVVAVAAVVAVFVFVLDNETLPYNDVLNIKIKMPAIQIQTLYY